MQLLLQWSLPGSNIILNTYNGHNIPYKNSNENEN